jgi:cold shock CspA family protein
MKRQTAFVAIALLSLLLTMTFPASASGQGRSARAAGTTTLISVASDGTQGNDASVEPSISATGRFVAFTSFGSSLVSGDTNGASDVFVHDRQTDQTTRVSVASDGSQGDEFSDAPSISSNGRYVAFFSLASNLVSGDTNGTGDVFVHDRATGQTTLVSVASDGTQANGGSVHAAISANGRFVAFQSEASNLVSGDANDIIDVFVHDRATGQTTLVSVASDGTQGNDLSLHPSLSGNGRYVAFDSFATNLVGSDTNGTSDVFIHDLQTGQTTLVSVASDGTQGSGYSDIPAISATGRYVAFHSFATNLVSGDTNFASDVFVHDRQTGQTTLISVASDGTQGNDNSDIAAISATGRYVAFHSFATNLVSDDTNFNSDTFVYDRKTGQTTRVSIASDGTQGNGFSGDPSISGGGRFVAFTSFATNLVNGDTNGTGDIFIHDRQSVGSVEEALPAELEAGDD